jgi:hypothetical protein
MSNPLKIEEYNDDGENDDDVRNLLQRPGTVIDTTKKNMIKKKENELKVIKASSTNSPNDILEDVVSFEEEEKKLNNNNPTENTTIQTVKPAETKKNVSSKETNINPEEKPLLSGFRKFTGNITNLFSSNPKAVAEDVQFEKETGKGGKRRSRKRNQKKTKKNHKKRNQRKSKRHRR